jgi:hypothetical protein
MALVVVGRRLGIIRKGVLWHESSSAAAEILWEWVSRQAVVTSFIRGKNSGENP